MPKIGHFGGLRVGTTKNEKKRKKLEFFLRVLDFQKFAKRRAGKHQRRKKNENKKKTEKTTEKKQRKKLGFLRFWIFKNGLKIGHFGGLRASLGGRAGNPPKWKLWGAFPYKNLCKGKFGAARSSKMESLGNLSNFGDDFGDVFGDK